VNTLWIPRTLSNLNDLIRQRGIRFGKNGASAYSASKAKLEETVGVLALARGFRVQPGCWAFSFLYVESDRRRDPDNIAGGARKVILDALQRAKLMNGDGWRTVRSIHEEFTTTSLSPTIATTGILLTYGPEAVSKTDLEVMAHVESSDSRGRIGMHPRNPKMAP
jgi:hypothetical protein